MSIIALKYFHISCVLLSYTLFFLRGVWMLRAASILQRRWVKVVPHIVDSALLLSAVTLAFQLSISPFASPWLMAKIIALLLYIVLGTYALKRGRTKNIRLAAWISAQLVFIYIVTVALAHNPLPWLAL
ncbi:MAG TPA: SirB2 family protein [Gallionellaceae bacterium]|nr:SirB2 family protein [Gallionellaceae bacterium]